MAKYLDSNGLLYFWQKIKSVFITDVSYSSSTKKITMTKNGSSSDVVTLSDVATSGSYNDLSDQPTIPTVPSAYTSAPAMDGNTASAGSSTQWSRGDHVHPHDTSRAPASHASTSTTYGVGNDANYGHVKLSNSTSSTQSVNAGTAATPKAVSDALSAANTYTDTAVGNVDVGVTGVKGATESSFRTGNVNITLANIGAAASSHTHGNITNSGDITAEAPTIAAGDRLVINDDSASKITNGPAFGNDAGRFLCHDGSWDIPTGTYTHPSYTAHTTSQLYKFTVDAKGHVDSATAATASDIVSLLGTTAVNRATADASGNNIANTYAPKASPALTGTPTAPTATAGTNTTQIATTAFVKTAVDNAITDVAGAMVYKGVVDDQTDITGTSYKKGWYWIVAMPDASTTSITIGGVECEAGDMVIAKQDKTSTIADDIDVVQSNISIITNAEIDTIVAA